MAILLLVTKGFTKIVKNTKIIFPTLPSILTWILLLSISSTLLGENTGYKFIKNFSKKDYDHYDQNWGFTQDQKTGLLYVANQAGLLQFDGVSWDVWYKEIPNKTIRSLAIAPNGTVYLGGNNEIGYLKTEPGKRPVYISLSGSLEEEYKDFSSVYYTLQLKEFIFFMSTKFLFRLDTNTKEIKVWPAHTPFKSAFVCREELFLQQNGVGLLTLHGDALQPIPGGETFSNAEEEYRVFMLVPYNNNDGTLLIGTRQKGLFLYDGQKATPFPTKIDDFIVDSRPYSGTLLSTGEFALATRSNGLVVINKKGEWQCTYNKKAGLIGENVKSVFEDREGNVWLALQNGISMIEYRSPFFIYDKRCNIEDEVLDLARHNNDLYASTTKGLYVLPAGKGEFQPVQGVPSNCFSLLSTPTGLLVATEHGLFLVDNKKPNRIRRILHDRTYTLSASKDKRQRIFCGISNGFVGLSFTNGTWIETHRQEKIGREIRSIAIAPDGNPWLGTMTGDVFHVALSSTGNPTSVNHFDKNSGLPGGETIPVRAAGHVMFVTNKGLFRFDQERNEFIPDPVLDQQFTGGPKGKPVFRLVEDDNKNIWLHSESRNYHFIPGSNGSFLLEFKPFRRLPVFQCNTIIPEQDKAFVWFGGQEMICRYDTSIKKSDNVPFDTLIRKTWINGRLVVNGNGPGNPEKNKQPVALIDYDDRNLRFEFAAPFFTDATEITYQWLLDGYDKEWSAWSKETRKDYTNIEPGNNIFRVRARNVYGDISREASFHFRVSYPWYRTWWAIIIYIVSLFLLVFLFVKLRSMKLVKEKQHLEKIVKERTLEISDKNVQLKEQSEQLQEMDRIKSRFFANLSHEFRTPLTLIMSPLEDMLNSSKDAREQQEINSMLTNSQQLLAYINQLLDLSRFDSGQMKLQASRQDIVVFMNGVIASFRSHAEKNKITLEFQTEEDELLLFYDSGKMHQVMNNLLFNALKFTPPGGKVTVALSCITEAGDNNENKKDFVSISVRDTGRGIAKEQLDKIFDRFFQSDPQGGGTLKGAGIGLALTREIVMLHHGKINVNSQLKKGTEFVVLLPLGDDHLQPGEKVMFLPTENESQPQLLSQQPPAEDSKSLLAGSDTQPDDKINKDDKNVILVVEDHPDMRRHIRSTLEPHYHVVEARDGEEGIVKAREIIPDLIVSDVMMPKIDGNELCRAVKKDIATSHIPVILLTAKAAEEHVIEGLETGANDYVTKPFNKKILLTRIDNLLELRKQLQLKIQRQELLLPPEIKVSSQDEKFLKELKELIEKNIANPDFSVDHLYGKLLIGRSTLFRKVQALTGESPNQFILNYRLQRGAQLLKENFGNVTEVAMAVGFNSSTYFSKCFKEKFHRSPSAFQNAESQSSKPEKPGKQ